ncbi:MAG TPA: hypothetical protein DHW10_03635, partial [Rhodospirillaceae bacterium]|nr:hypothetical protein [Rhodospirillaceae bacterium]
MDTIQNYISYYEITTMHAKSIRPETIAYSYEYMVQSKGTQTAVFSAVCADWGIEFKPEMLEFKDNFGA